ncbi:hypothetical protein KUV73_00200 [Mameliella alba]|nr:hypothetical protein [Mameliella alba]MBY6167734.1 hypothetical protein [Mameliella alba]MBY6172755.1 hypothetical protein [Mameliella alba]
MFRPLITAVLVLLTMASSVTAARIEVVARSKDPEEHARLRLSGPIAEGDAQKLKTLMSQEISGYYPDTHFVTLTLDSPGGSFAEAIRLMEMLRDVRVATRIEKNASCLSACAVAFMGGTRIIASDFRSSRMVEPGGRLGFHAPSLTLPGDQLVSTKVLGASYNLALETIASILSRRNRFDIPVSLVETMIATPPEQMYILETVDDFARWRIDVDMDSSQWRPDASDVARMCLNYGTWEQGDSVARRHAAQPGQPTRAQQVRDRARRVRFLDPAKQTGVRSVFAYASETGMEVSTCVIRFTIFRDQWHPRIFLSDSPPEVALEAARQSNSATRAPYMLHALPHDFRIEKLR